jgi:hypothetical protein
MAPEAAQRAVQRDPVTEAAMVLEPATLLLVGLALAAMGLLLLVVLAGERAAAVTVLLAAAVLLLAAAAAAVVVAVSHPAEAEAEAAASHLAITTRATGTIPVIRIRTIPARVVEDTDKGKENRND